MGQAYTYMPECSASGLFNFYGEIGGTSAQLFHVNMKVMRSVCTIFAHKFVKIGCISA